MARYKGLTGPQRGRLLGAFRPDTIVTNGAGYPAIAPIDVPADGTPVAWWYDAGYGGAALSRDGTPIEYDANVGNDGNGALRFFYGDASHLHCLPGLDYRNELYWQQFHTGDFMFALRVGVLFDQLAAGDVAPIMYTQSNGDMSSLQPGIAVVAGLDSSGSQYLRAQMNTDFTTTAWDTGQVSLEFGAELNTLVIAQDAAQGAMEVRWNGEVVDTQTGFSVASTGTPPARPLTFGADPDGRAFDGFIQALLVEDRISSLSGMTDWTLGNRYHAA